MPLKPMNHHYAIENPASVYDEEAMTALELAGRTTAKVNETVEAFNKLETDTNVHLDNQDDTIRDRMQAQDNRLTHMEDVQIPDAVFTQVQGFIESGSFDRSIDKYAGNLEVRVDNLLAHTVSGSITERDGEVLDIRLSADNFVHDNAGESVRNQVQNLKSAIKNVPGLIRKNLVTRILPGIYKGDLSFDEAMAYHAEPFYLNNGEVIFNEGFNTFGTYSNKLYRFDENGTCVGATEPYNTIELPGNVTRFVYKAPRDGWYTINISSTEKHYAVVAKAVDELYDTRQGVFLPEILNPGEILQHVEYEIKRPNLVREILPGYYNHSLGFKNENHHTNPIKLLSGETVYTTDVYPTFGGNTRAYRYDTENDCVLDALEPNTDPTLPQGDFQIYTIIEDGWYVFNAVSSGMCVTRSLADLDKPMGSYLPEDIIYPDYSIFGNPLEGKTIVFDGDSICHGTSVGEDDPTYGWGWAGRIGTKNNMDWQNVSQSGATITAERYLEDGTPRHWLCTNIDTIIANNPNLDYLILEGGVNDADLLTRDKSEYGSYNNSYGDTSAFDITTFCGALDYLCYKVTTKMPNTKVGFIIPPKMGIYDNYAGSACQRRYFFTQVQSICQKWGIPYLDLWINSTLNPRLTEHYNRHETVEVNRSNGSFYTDGQHLTSAGYDRITPQIEAWIKTL